MFSIEEMGIILVVAVLLFGGGTQIPKLARSLGRATGEFKRGQMELQKEIRNSVYAGSSTETEPGKVDFYEIAKNMGLDTTDKSESQIKEEIAQKLKN